jgi:hypothetical protein
LAVRCLRLDSRALVILRETLAFHSPLADFAFAMQGLGSGAITLAGTADAAGGLSRPAVARGDRIAAFALSEPEAGSDVAAMTNNSKLRIERWDQAKKCCWIRASGPKDLDQQRRHCRLLLRLRQDRIPKARHPWHHRVSWWMPIPRGWTAREHIACDGAAHPLATLRSSMAAGCRHRSQLGALSTVDSSSQCRRWTSFALQSPVLHSAWPAAPWHEAVAHARQRPHVRPDGWPISS